MPPARGSRASLLAIGLLLNACGSGSDPYARLAIEFEGAEAFSEGELREVIVRDLERYVKEPRDAVLEDAAFRLVHHYRLHGYADARVEVDAAGGAPAFRIREGPQVRLGRVHFRGNRVLTDREIEELVPSVGLGDHPLFSKQRLAFLRDELVSIYQARGYMAVEIKEPRLSVDPDGTRVHVTVEIVEGPRYRLAGIEGLDGAPRLRRTLAHRLGPVYTSWTVQDAEDGVARFYLESGHPFVHARATPRVDRDAAEVVLEMDVRPGARAVVDSVRVTGNELTRSSYIRLRADLDEGREYQASDLRRAEDRLLETRLFRTVRVTEGSFQEETGRLQVEIQVEEREAAEVAVRGGFGTLEGAKGGADIAYENLFGGGESVKLGGTVSSLGYRIESAVSMPYFLGSDFRPGAGGAYEDREFPSFRTIRTSGVGSLHYSFLAELTASTGLHYARIRTLELEEEVPPGDRLDFDYLALFLGGSWDGRDSAFLPTRGVLLTGYLEWADEAFSPDIQFLSAAGRVVGHVPVRWGLALAVSLQGGIIVPTGETDEIPVSIRQFAGGTGTVRGFAPDTIGPKIGDEPIGGEVFLAAQTELRFPIWGGFHGAVFADRGGVWFEHDKIDLSESRYAVGVGLRYYTVAGALAVDVAWNVSPEEDEDDVVPHFSIGFPF